MLSCAIAPRLGPSPGARVLDAHGAGTKASESRPPRHHLNRQAPQELTLRISKSRSVAVSAASNARQRHSNSSRRHGQLMKSPSPSARRGGNGAIAMHAIARGRKANPKVERLQRHDWRDGIPEIRCWLPVNGRCRGQRIRCKRPGSMRQFPADVLISSRFNSILDAPVALGDGLANTRDPPPARLPRAQPPALHTRSIRSIRAQLIFKAPRAGHHVRAKQLLHTSSASRSVVWAGSSSCGRIS